jgi:hypothetical protein
MPLRKLPDPEQWPSVWTAEKKTCFHPEHDPPTMILLEPGLYEHTCPGCGRVTTFRIVRPGWSESA